MSEHERIGKWMRRIAQPGATLSPRHDIKMCVVVSSDVIDLIDAIEAKLEKCLQDKSNLYPTGARYLNNPDNMNDPRMLNEKGEVITP